MRSIRFLFQVFFCMAVMIPSNDLFAQVYMKNLGTRGIEVSLEMTPTSDGNYVTVGPVTRPPTMGPGLDIYLNKVDPAGVLIWSRQIAEVGANGSGRSVPLSITETFDASGAATGFAVTGRNSTGKTEDPIFVATTDVNGLPIAYNTYGGALPTTDVAIMDGRGVKIIQTPEGDLAICGSVLLAHRVGHVPFILVVEPDLNLRFLRLYHDARYFEDVFGRGVSSHFADIEVIHSTTSPNGGVIPEGFVIVGTTSKMKEPFTEILVMRTDLHGNPMRVGIYGPQQIPSYGTAVTVASNGELEVAGLVRNLSGGPPSTLVLKVDSSTLAQLDLDEYYGFVTHGDIRELSNGDFILSGRASFDLHAALLRIRPDGTVVFGLGYGGPNVEIFTDVHEMHGGDLYASGFTTTWCRGPVDEYLVRTQPDGLVPGCEVYTLNMDHAEPHYPPRRTKVILEELKKVVEHGNKLIKPGTLVELICPVKIVVHPWPLDWYIRGDFDRDLKLDMKDAISTLNKLYIGGDDARPKEAADANSDGYVDVTDVVYSLSYLYLGGNPPRAPFPTPGPDPRHTEKNIFTLEELQRYVSFSLNYEETHFSARKQPSTAPSSTTVR
jgi:hypothetical protein